MVKYPFLDDSHSLEVGSFSLEDNPEVPLPYEPPHLHMFYNYTSIHDVGHDMYNCFQGNKFKDPVI